MARHKRTVSEQGAWLVFEDESGQGLRPPKGRTWGHRGRTPVVTVTGGHNSRVSLAALIAALGFSLGGLLSAVISIGVTRLLGTPVPSGFRFAIAPSDELVVPWPIYTFAAALGGMLAGGLVAAVVVVIRYRRRTAAFQNPAEGDRSEVAGAYAASTAGPRGSTGDGPAYPKHKAAIAKAWALALADPGGAASGSPPPAL